MKRITSAVRAEVRRLNSAGFRTDQIAQKLGISEAQVVIALGR